MRPLNPQSFAFLRTPHCPLPHTDLQPQEEEEDEKEREKEEEV